MQSGQERHGRISGTGLWQALRLGSLSSSTASRIEGKGSIRQVRTSVTKFTQAVSKLGGMLGPPEGLSRPGTDGPWPLSGGSVAAALRREVV